MAFDLTGLRPDQADLVASGLLWSGPPLVWQSPTSSGKTFTARYALRHALDQGQRAVLTVPLRAIANEVTARLRVDPMFADATVARLTGELGEDDGEAPVSPAAAQTWVATYEKLDSLLRRPGTHYPLLASIGVLVIDEAHLLGEGRRGALLEGVIVRLRAINPLVQVVLLSATLGNGPELAEWLAGIYHRTSERPVPLAWERRTFKKAADKPGIAAEACREVADAGGQSIVFVQSRQRAQDLAGVLADSHALRAGFHHAGLTRSQRDAVEGDFREGRLDVLCATPTLAAGVNLPARQVVLYDTQRYVGASTYEDLSVIDVWQRAGRAGRLGLDQTGRVVVIQPGWGKQKDYSRGTFEPIRSALMDRRLAAEQVLVAVASGYARTESQIERFLSATLAARQRRLHPVVPMIALMREAGMLEADDDGALYATRAGHIAVAHMLAPEGVVALVRLFQHAPNATVLDLLLVCSALPGSDFSVWAKREDRGDLEAVLSRHGSRLAGDPARLADLGIHAKSSEDGLTRAAVLLAWCETGDAAAAGALAGYSESDVLGLRQEVLRVLQAARALADVTEPRGPTETLDRAFAMVSAGLDGEAALLALIPGIGPVLARRLVAHGITTLTALANASATALAALPGVAEERAQTWRFAAGALVEDGRWLGLGEDGCARWTIEDLGSGEPRDYRDLRARELTVTGEGEGAWTVTGGTAPHRVWREGAGLACDCQDFAAGHRCKHVRAVSLSL